jgi:hypothetical protein
LSSYERVLKNIPRTTNTVEAWHRSINKDCQISHPNIARFIEMLKRQEEETRFNIIQISNGVCLPNVGADFKKEYYLRNVVENYYNFECDAYFNVIKLITYYYFDE